MDKLLSFLNVKVLGGVLAASLMANAFLFWGYTHQAEKKAECIQTVKVANKIATEKKVIVENRQEKLNVKTEDAITNRIAVATRRLHKAGSRITDSAGTPSSTPGANEEGGTPLLLPDDARICVTNTILAEAWQEWYFNLIEIRKEENGTDTKDRGVSSPRRGASLGSVPRQRGYLDVGSGSDEQLGAPSIPTVQEEPSDN